MCVFEWLQVRQWHRLQALLKIHPDIQGPDPKFERHCKAVAFQTVQAFPNLQSQATVRICAHQNQLNFRVTKQTVCRILPLKSRKVGFRKPGHADITSLATSTTSIFTKCSVKNKFLTSTR